MKPLNWQTVKKTTPDAILEQFDDETLLRAFQDAKATANVADAARDRLRDYVKEHVEAGQHGPFILEKKLGSERAYANSEGVHFLREGLIVSGPRVEPGLEVTVRDKEGHILSRGVVIDNEGLYSVGGSVTLKIIELP